MIASPQPPSAAQPRDEREADGARRRDPLSRLIVAIGQSRDRERFAELFESVAPRLKSYFLRRGFGPGPAEDLCQDVMLIIWRKAESFDPVRASASTWIFTIARNRGADLHRQATYAREIAPVWTQAQEAPLGPDTLLLEVERNQKVQAAIAALPPGQADLVRRSFFQERTHCQIANDLGLPLGTVKSRLRLAVGRLRDLWRVGVESEPPSFG